MDKTIRARVEQILAAHYRDLSIVVRSAELVEEGIVIRGLSISERGTSPAVELAQFDEVFLACDADLAKLMMADPRIESVTIRRPIFRATREADGSWSTARLLPPPKFGSGCKVTIESAAVEIVDATVQPPSILALQDGQLTIEPPRAAATAQSTSAPPLATQAGVAQPSTQAKAPGVFSLRGTFMGKNVQRIDVEGSFHRDGGQWALRGKVEGLDVGPELTRSLPAPAYDRLRPLESLRGRVSAGFHVSTGAAAGGPVDFHVDGQLERGRVDDSRLPYPLTNLSAHFRADPTGVMVENLTAECGATQLELSVHRQGYGEYSPLSLTAKAERLQLDHRLVAILPTDLQGTWNKFLPAGVVDLNAKVTFDGREWHPDIEARCSNAAFTFYKFPFRVEHASGRITLKDDQLRADMKAFIDVEEVTMMANIMHPGPNWSGEVQVRGNHIPLNKKLFSALPEAPQATVESLSPHGDIGLFARLWRDPRESAAVHKYMWIGLNNCGLTFDKFKYPLENVRGTIEVADDIWTFHDIVGANDTARVLCKGQLRPGPEGRELRLHFEASDVPLDEELRDALRPSAREFWNAMRPAGHIQLVADVHHKLDLKENHIALVAQPVGESVSIEPAYFPYRLERVQGAFQYNDGKVRLDGLKARHGPNTVLAARGSCQVEPHGGWQLWLEHFSAGPLEVDRDLLTALPGRLRKTVTDIQLGGPLNLRGGLFLASEGRPGTPFKASWDLDVDMQQAHLHCGIPLDNVNGGVRLIGNLDQGKLTTRGELNIDSLTSGKLQFTDVRGPLWIDDRQVLLGAWAARTAPGQPERNLTARFAGGVARADGWAVLGERPRYNIDATLSRADLSLAAAELVSGRPQSSGIVDAQVNLQGQGRGAHSLGGHGQIRLREADIYELPLMVSLLKIVSVKVPDATAFTDSDVDFRIEGEHVYLDRVDFHGDAISLRGVGEMGLDRSVALRFHAMVGRDKLNVPLVSDLIGGASQQLMLIHVRGTVDNPIVERQPLPMLNQALQQVQADLPKSSPRPERLPPPDATASPAPVARPPYR